MVGRCCNRGSIWRECDLVSQGYPLGNPEQWRAAEEAGVRDTQHDWRLLVQLDTDEDADWMWGDAGSLDYAVRAGDATAAVFDNAWMVLQCG